VEGLFAEVTATHGRLDLLCNLVGGFAAAGVAETDTGTWQRMWDLNATAPFLCIRSAVPLLRRTGGGRIVNVAAAAAMTGPKAGMSAYLAAKSAVASLTENLAEELAADGITVNAVAPTIIDTPANRAAMPDADRGTWLDPAEIAAVIRFLAGPDATVVSGNVLTLRK
jgi:NAD(P)-dependent dehydrogenase (short-subunit alcohol dehydrogenase family)